MKKQKFKYLFSFILITFLIYILYTLITNIYFEMFKLNNQERELIVERLNQEIELEKDDDKREVKRELRYLGTLEGHNVIAKLEIPKIDINLDILEEYTEESLKISITKFFGSNPNDIGNFCISGHNYKINNNNMFVNLKKLEIDDEIILTDGYNKQLKYKVYDIFKVFPKETNSLSQKTNGKTEMTLITCTSDSKQRIIVKAVSKDGGHARNEREK